MADTNINTQPPVSPQSSSPVPTVPDVKQESHVSKSSWLNKVTKKITNWKSNKKLMLGLGGAILILLIILIGKELEISKQMRLESLKNLVVKSPEGQPIRSQLPVSDTGEFTKLQIPERKPSFFSLKPTTVTKFGILPQENFVLTSQQPTKTQFIEQHIETTVPVKVSAKTDQEIIISPRSAMKLDQVFQVRLLVNDLDYEGYRFDRDYGWAYQTQGKFRVISHLPGNKKTKVPVKTGIELVFSQDDYQDPADLINIEPQIEYRLEIHEETLAIVPIQPLQYQTVYTVTLKKGLNLKSRNDPINEDFVFAFQTEPPPEPIQKPVTMSLRKTFVQSTPAEPAQIQVYTYNWNSQSVKALVYRFPNGDDFMKSRGRIDDRIYGWYNYYPEIDQVNTDNLTLITEAELQLQTRERIEYLQLPDPLATGFYLIQFWYDEGKKLEQLWIQSSSLGGYTSVGKQYTLVWVNDLVNGNAGNDVLVSPYGLASNYLTNNEGWVIFDTPSGWFENKGNYLTLTKDNQQLILPILLENRNQPSEVAANDFWSYLYQERRMYKADDVVNFWGVIKDRDTDQPPGNVKIELNGSTYGKDDPKWSQTVTPQANGSFIGQVKLPGVANGWYSLRLKVGNVQVESSNFEVIDYVKPEMKIEVKTDKQAVFTGESIKFTGLLKFFDNTPVSKAKLNAYANYGGKKTELTTNQQGEAEYVYTPQYEKTVSYPRYESMTFSPALAQQGTIEGHASVRVYGSKLMISTDSEQDGKTAHLQATINRVDLSQLNQGSGDLSSVKGNAVPNQTVNLKITKSWYEKVETGTYYDFIEKVTRKTYQYNRHEETIYNQQLTTNQQGQISYQFEMEQNRSYKAEVSVTDEDQHPTSRSEYYYYYEGRNYEYQGTGSESPQLQLNKKENTYSAGENVEVKVNLGEESYPDTDKNRFLFITAQRGEQQAIVREGPQYDFTFGQQQIPNVYVAGVIFTGSSFYPVNAWCQWEWSCGYYYEDFDFNGLIVKYQAEDSQLDLSLSSDQVNYQPGDEAKLFVHVNKDGQAVNNATVNIALVDEALAVIGGARKPNLLPDLYKNVGHEIYFSYYTHEPLFAEKSMAEMGGGGGDRDIFKDTGFFGQAQTNESGQAEFSFTLPDNITTWLVYGQAVNQQLQAGQLEGKVVVTKDFFVTNQFPRQWLAADKAYVTASAFGVNLDQQAKVDYTFIFWTNDEEQFRKEQWQTAYQPLEFGLPTLEAGDYQLSIRGKSGKLEDGVRLPVKITNSRINFPYQSVRNLNAGESLSGLDSSQILKDRKVKLVVSDIGKGRYYWQLRRFCYQSSNRLEKQLASIRADQVLQEYFEDSECQPLAEELSIFQGGDGGLSQVWWGGSHLETSMWASVVGAEYFDHDLLADYFNQQLINSNSGTVNQLQAIWGLAGLDEPAINRLHLLANQAVSFEEKLLAGLALASSGEIESARDIYYDLLADYAYAARPYVRMQRDSNTQANADTMLEDTSMTLLLGALVDPQYNEGFYDYLRDFHSNAEDIVLDLGQMSFIKTQLSELPLTDTQLTYTSAIKNEQKILSKGKNWIINLSDQELDNFNLKVNQGKAETAVNYYVGADGLAKLEPDPRLKISRSFQKVEGGDKIIPGDMVKVTLKYDLDRQDSPLGGYTVTDLLPSGLTYVSNPKLYGLQTNDWVREDNPQEIKYRFYNSLWYKGVPGTVTYYARASAVGNYVAEPAIIQSLLDPGVFNYTSQETVNIESISGEKI